MKTPKSPIIKLHIHSSNLEEIKKAVHFQATLFCLINGYDSATITEIPVKGDDGKYYLGHMIEKKTPAENH